MPAAMYTVYSCGKLGHHVVLPPAGGGGGGGVLRTRSVRVLGAPSLLFHGPMARDVADFLVLKGTVSWNFSLWFLHQKMSVTWSPVSYSESLEQIASCSSRYSNSKAILWCGPLREVNFFLQARADVKKTNCELESSFGTCMWPLLKSFSGLLYNQRWGLLRLSEMALLWKALQKLNFLFEHCKVLVYAI